MITKVKIEGYRVFENLAFSPNPRTNIFVGTNETGKSTLMEAIALALTGRINGRRAVEELNPYWFNATMVRDFLRKRREGKPAKLPEIRIELFFENRPELQYLAGAINTAVPTMACPGVTMHVAPNPEYTEELNAWVKDASLILPVEYYKIDWRSFSDIALASRPRHLAAAVIDSRTVRSSTGVDYHMRQILGDHLAPAERADLSLSIRKSSSAITESVLKDVNTRIAEQHKSLHARPITLAMDQRSSWENAITPHVDDVPFSMSGQGQQAALKISLAMSRNSASTNFVLVEEPENHLAHTSLAMLLARMQALAGAQQQLFVTTHSSFVLNRLGLDALHLHGRGTQSKISALSADTVGYFKKLPGYDTLRMVLARKVVLVEGPSDEIIFERVFRDRHKCLPMDAEIDVLSMRGLSLARCLELCAALDKPVAALRDNDGLDPASFTAPLKEWLSTGRRELFVGVPANGETLEPQLVHFNGEPAIRKILNITDSADLSTWMKREKTEGALRIASSQAALVPPDYMLRAADFIWQIK